MAIKPMKEEKISLAVGDKADDKFAKDLKSLLQKYYGDTKNVITKIELDDVEVVGSDLKIRGVKIDRKDKEPEAPMPEETLEPETPPVEDTPPEETPPTDEIPLDLGEETVKENFVYKTVLDALNEGKSPKEIKNSLMECKRLIDSVMLEEMTDLMDEMEDDTFVPEDEIEGAEFETEETLAPDFSEAEFTGDEFSDEDLDYLEGLSDDELRDLNLPL